MESDDEFYLFESSSDDEVSDGEIADYLVKNVNTEILSDPLPSVSGLNIRSAPNTEQVIADENMMLSEKAYEIIDGNMSFDEYAQFIKKEKQAAGGSYVSPEVQGLIGQANMKYAKGDREETFRLCKEAIRISPRAAEPYRTLSELLEEGGDHVRALQLKIFATELGCRDGQVWMECGDKAIELDMLKIALHCFSKAVTCDPTLLHAHQSRLRLYQELGDCKSNNFTKIIRKTVRVIPAEHGEFILEQAKLGASVLHGLNDENAALELMESAFTKCPKHVKFDDVNLIVELYMALQKHERALEVIARYCDVEISAEEQILAAEGQEEVTTTFKVEKVQINSALPPQLRTKLATILIHFEAFHLVDDVINPLLDQVNDYGDVLLDVTEAYAAIGRHSDVVRLLKTLLKAENMKQPQVWLQYGEALKAIGKFEEAVQAFLEVMAQAPQLAEPRLIVSELLNHLGRREEALSALSQDPSAHMDVGLLFERCLILMDKSDRENEFMVAGRLLISRHCSCIRSQKEVVMLTRLTTCSRRADAIRKLQEDIVEETPTYVVGQRMPTLEEEWTIFRRMCDIAFKQKQFALLQRLLFSALTSKVLCPTREREAEILALAAMSSYFNGDSKNAFNLLRIRVMSDVNDSPRVWTLFNAASLAGDEVRHQKFIMRLIARKPLHPALPTLFANNCFISGSYKQAICEYLLQLKHSPSALISLLVAITFTMLSSQKTSKTVNALVTQAQGFMARYKELRDAAAGQEIEYNLGRLHHHLNLLPTALYHYHRALKIPAICPMLDLTKEAAYNIALIYQGSGSHELAQSYIQKYIVI